MDKVFQGYAGSLGIRDPAVVGKAREIYRRSTAMKTLLLGPGECCRAMACFELACEALGHEVAPQTAARLAGADEKRYQQALLVLHRSLGCKPATSLRLRDVLTRLGCADLEGPVAQAQREYRQRALEEMPPNHRDSASFALPAVPCAALLLVARKLRRRVDQAAALRAWGVSRQEVWERAQAMTRLLPQLAISVVKRSKKSTEGAAEGTGSRAKGSAPGDVGPRPVTEPGPRGTDRDGQGVSGEGLSRKRGRGGARKACGGAEAGGGSGGSGDAGVGVGKENAGGERKRLRRGGDLSLGLIRTLVVNQ